jgi:cholesterol transport system auxiliary component
MSMHRLLITLVALVLGACTVLPATDPVRVYQLLPAERPVRALPVYAGGLRVLRPQVDDLLNGSHILVLPEGEPVSLYKGARWSAPIPRLLRDYLVESLRQDGRFGGVSSDEVRLRAEHELVSRLSTFQTEYRHGQPVVVIRLHLQLVDTATRRILQERTLRLERPAASTDLEAVIRAYDQAAGQLATIVADWLAAGLDMPAG